MLHPIASSGIVSQAGRGLSIVVLAACLGAFGCKDNDLFGGKKFDYDPAYDWPRNARTHAGEKQPEATGADSVGLSTKARQVEADCGVP
jgi:hypothetical protein